MCFFGRCFGQLDGLAVMSPSRAGSAVQRRETSKQEIVESRLSLLQLEVERSRALILATVGPLTLLWYTLKGPPARSDRWRACDTRTNAKLSLRQQGNLWLRPAATSHIIPEGHVLPWQTRSLLALFPPPNKSLIRSKLSGHARLSACGLASML